MKNLRFGKNNISNDIEDEGEEKPLIEFHEMSREERLEQLTNINEDSSKDWVGLKSLTGANASGWKFEDPYYGKFNVGKRPSMDTAWGRRVYDQVQLLLLCFRLYLLSFIYRVNKTIFSHFRKSVFLTLSW